MRPQEDLVKCEPDVIGYSFFGKRGAGKTLGLVGMLYQGYLENASIYCNIHLNFNFTRITNTSFHQTIENDGKNKIVALDDLCAGNTAGAGSLHEKELNRVLSLFRKLVGRGNRSIFISSTPNLDQYSKTVRNFTDYWIYPELLKYKQSNFKKWLNLYILDHFPRKYEDLRESAFRVLHFDLEENNLFALYDTGETPKTIVSGIYRDIFKEMKHYANKSIKKTVLTQKIADKFGVSITQAKLYADSILEGYDPDESEKEESNEENLSSWFKD